MLISDYLDTTRILLRERAEKVSLLADLVSCLATQGLIADSADILEAVLEREQQFSTGVGGGLAVPHARSSQIESLVAAMAVIGDGMDFQALDDQPVHVVLLFISPESDATAHSEFLAAVSAVFQAPETVERLARLSTSSPAEVLKALKAAERSRS